MLIFKYITYQCDDEEERIIIFDMNEQHVDIFKTFKDKGCVAVSAGQIYFGNDGFVMCVGESLTLNISSRGNVDVEVFKKVGSNAF